MPGKRSPEALERRRQKRLEQLREKHSEVKAPDVDNHPCQLCHNSLLCLEWYKDGRRARCPNSGEFAKYYGSGVRKLMGADDYQVNK